MAPDSAPLASQATHTPPVLAVIGSINVDLVARAPRLPQAGETVGGGVFTTVPGGKGANQAAAAARLGATTHMIGAVGDDSGGDTSLRALRDAGVHTESVRIVPGVATGTALIAVDHAGENQIVVAPGANDHILADTESLRGAHGVLAQLEIPMAQVIAAAQATPGLFVLNAAPALPLPPALLDRADLIIVNETEYRLIPELAAAPRVVVSLGERGAALLSHGQVVAEVPTVAAQVRNTVGAGDAFCAALTVALLRGFSDAEALSLACAVGSAAVEDDRSQPEFGRLDSYRSPE